MREAVLNGMEWMGIHLDVEANRANAQIISAKHSPTIVFVIPTDEERMIAEHTIATAGFGQTAVNVPDRERPSVEGALKPDLCAGN